MSQVLKPFLVIRNHWKKSIFFTGVALFGAKFIDTRIKVNSIMSAYCKEASIVGEEPWHPQRPLRHLTVILNPVSNYRKGQKLYYKYIQPILHCAGIKISLIETENEGQASNYMEIMSDTDGVVVVGGSGTAHEAIVGYLRRDDLTGDRNLPIAFLPIGNRNSSILNLLGIQNDGYGQIGDRVNHVKILGHLTLNIVKEITKSLDVIRIETKNDQKPLFALYSLDYGIFSDIFPTVDKYWYLGRTLKSYYPLIKNIFFKDLANSKSPEIQVTYTKPCTGCAKCFKKFQALKPEEVPRKWWQMLIPRPSALRSKPTEKSRIDEIKNIVNEDCGSWHTLSENNFINLSLRNSFNDGIVCHYHSASQISKAELFKDGLALSRDLEPNSSSVGNIALRDISLRAISNTGTETEDQSIGKFVIDGQSYTFGDAMISLLPKRLNVYRY